MGTLPPRVLSPVMAYFLLLNYWSVRTNELSIDTVYLFSSPGDTPGELNVY